MNLSMHRLGSLAGVLAGTATVAAIVISHQAAVSALTFDEVRKIAVPVTVTISNQNKGGSGVIVAKQGNSYTVLTNRHVVDDQASYQIRTSDNDVHPVKVVKRFQDVDLAVVQFESVKTYPIATLGNSALSSVGDTVFAFGYPGVFDRATGGIVQKYHDSQGIVLALNAPNNQGFVIKHRADTPRGMSGGPTFDATGRLIAINGEAGVTGEFSDATAPPETDGKGQITRTWRFYVQTYSGEWFSIPINTVLAQLSEDGIALPNSKRDNTPPPNNRERIANPKNAGDFYLRASIADQKGNVRAAIGDYSKAIAFDPNFLDAYMSRGTAFYTAKEFSRAIADFTEVIQRPSGNLKIYAYINRGAARAQAGDKRGAIADYTQAIQLNPEDTYAYYNRGIVRVDAGDKQGAIADYTQAIQLNPKNAYAYSNRGVVRAKLGDKQSAIIDFTQAIQLNPKYSTAYYNRGSTRYELGDKQSAIADFTQAIQLNPKDSNAYNNRGFARYELGDKQGAIADFTQAIQLNPKFGRAYVNRGGARYGLGDKQGAIADFTQAIQLDSKFAAPAYYNRGNVRAELGDKQGAVADLTQAIQLNRKFAFAYAKRGIAHAELGNKQRAIADLTTAADLFRQQQDMDKYNLTIALIKKLESQLFVP